MKRTKMNEMLLKGFVSGDGIAANGYKASLNGEWYFKLRNNTMYGPKCLFLRTDMGSRVIQLNDDNIEESAELIQETLINLDKIVESEKRISEYCVNNPWTYSGT